MGPMLIVLDHMLPDVWPAPEGWIVVGRVGSRALAYDEARRPYLIGDGEPEALDPAAVNPALLPAVDAACLRIWPGGWVHALPAALGLNTRTTSRDRIAAKGLSPNVLRVIASASSHDDAEAMGRLLSALAHYADTVSDGPGEGDRIEDALRAAENAADMLASVRRGKTSRPEG